MARGLERGEVRLYRFRFPDKTRPVVVVTRDSSIHLLSTVTVAPITSTIRGVPSEVILSEKDGMKHPCAVNLHNMIMVEKQRLGPRVAMLGPERMSQLCHAISYALGCR
ncbi:MAG TPA: type II toxin-antitoxin system PemK/MazF family toxin [Candidatus Bathyarchaeia archaeon]|nr:type II toxin-antitoxin system PemK/MazF family toxin [Candidatus Bathyarchaeia archaeon]